MRTISVTLRDFELSIEGPRGKERLAITDDYPDNALSRFLFSQFGLMHLIAPYLPSRIKTDFWVVAPVRALINGMYAWEKKPGPAFDAPEPKVRFRVPPTDRNKVAVSYSGGKDSMWNMWWTQEKFGPESVKAIHIHGLNRTNASRERAYAERQSHALGFRHFQTIHLLNSSRHTGFQIMRSREMFLSAVITPLALEFGASRIITEGCAEIHPTEPFTSHGKNIKIFNAVLRKLGVPVGVSWRNKKEMDVVKDLLEHRPAWLPHVCNCFAAPCYVPSRRRWWQEHAPTFPLYESQCGACVKCRIINLGRILYDPAMQQVRDEDIRTFLINTAGWIDQNRVRLQDMIAGSFTRDFKRACKQHNLSLSSVA